MELIKILTEQLGVSHDQAQGGAGLIIMNYLKDKGGEALAGIISNALN